MSLSSVGQVAGHTTGTRHGPRQGPQTGGGTTNFTGVLQVSVLKQNDLSLVLLYDNITEFWQVEVSPIIAHKAKVICPKPSNK